jgi:hypothetical protein
MRRVTAVSLACLWACGDNHAGPADAAPGGDGPFQPAPHAPMPVVFPHTGTVLSSVHLVTLKFSDHAAQVDLARFGNRLVTSDWYHKVGAEYGFDIGTAELVDIGPAPTSISRADIAQKIIDLIAARRVPRPTAADELLYLLYVPPRVARGAGLQRSYHEMLTLSDGMRFPIAVVLDSGRSAADTTTTAAHQLINAVTNPYTPPKDGYYADPPKTDPWSLVRGEIGDLCEGEEPYADNEFAYPRVYSNRAAIASLPPCLPILPEDSWSDVTAEPATIQMIAAAGSVRFRLTGWSTRPLPAWNIRVQVADSSQLSADEMRPQLSSDTINNGQTVTLTLHAPPEGVAPGTTGSVYILSGKNEHPWAVGFVVKQ